jgi:amino acid adenylation domain-containing protein
MRRSSGPRTLAELLYARAERDGEAVAYTFLANGEDESARLTWRALHDEARALAAQLRDAGLAGERALLLYPTGPAYVVALFACFHAGVVAVPAYPLRGTRSDERIVGIAADCKPAALLTDAATLALVHRGVARAPLLQGLRLIATDARPRDRADTTPETVAPDAPAFLQYTSGSTAHPKGVRVTHANVLANEAMIAAAFGVTRDDVVLGWLPIYHDMGLVGNLLQPLFVGARCVLMPPTAFLQKPRRWLHAISRTRATVSGGPDFAYALCARSITDDERAGLDLGGWRVAFTGAEPVRAATMRRFADAFAPCGFRPGALRPCYGLAEATLIVAGTRDTAASDHVPPWNRTLAVAADGGSAPVSCGAVVPGLDVAIVDTVRGVTQPDGTVGEVWVAGPSVADGYWNDATVTEETFHARLPGDDRRYLRTGDLGAWQEGELFIAGRLKDLIIVRGRNHYPADLEETVEASHPALQPHGSTAFAIDRDGETCLAIVAELAPAADHARAPHGVFDAIQRALAEAHEIRADTLVLIRRGTLPRTSSGKVRREACRAALLESRLAVVAATSAHGSAHEADALTDRALRDEVVALDGEARVARLERHLLSELAALTGHAAATPGGAERRASDFGIDSLLAARLARRLVRGLGVELPLSAILGDGTVTDLAGMIATALGAAPSPPQAPAAGDASRYRISHEQRALAFLDAIAPSPGALNVLRVFEVTPAPDVAVLRRTIARLVERHGALRTTFDMADGVGMATVHPTGTFELGEAALDGTQRDGRAARVMAEAERRLDLARGPLLRVVVAHQPDGSALIVMVTHHLVADQWSLTVLIDELVRLYALERRGAAPPPLAAAMDYAAYARWQEALLAGPDGAALLERAAARLSGAPPLLDVPADHPRASRLSLECGAEAVTIDTPVVRALLAVARRAHATPYMAFVAACEVMLARYCGQAEFVLGSPAAARPATAFADAVGCFMNPIALRARVDDRRSFIAVLEDVRRDVLSALDDARCPLPVLLDRLRPIRDPGRSPLFQAMVVFDDLPAVMTGTDGTVWRITDVERLATPVDLTVALAMRGDHTVVRVYYRRDTWDAPTAAAFLDELATLLADLAARPHEPVGALGRRSRVTRAVSAAARSADDLVPARIVSEARRRPAAPAVRVQDRVVTYGELVARASRLAQRLRAHGIGPEAIVAIALPPSDDLVVALLAVGAAGAAYLPLDSAYPRARLELMVADAAARALIRRADAVDVLPGFTGLTITLPCADDGLGATPAPRVPLSPASLAYLIYTSGSTGRPKGVAVTHGAVANVFDALAARLRLTPDDVVAAATSVSFDIAAVELLLPLTVGATITIVDREDARDGWRLAAALDRDGATVFQATPSTWRLLVDAGWDGRRLRHAIAGGEALDADLAACLRGRGHSLWNFYGPTETTIWSTAADLTDQARVSIGSPLEATGLHVLDSRLRPAPLGAIGELFICGAGVARGYHTEPALTAERFQPDTCGGGGRMYRTGDFVRQRTDGTLDYVGRKDAQVKLRGFRIETGEIEAALREHSGVRAAAVVLAGNGTARHLAAYVVPAADPAPAVEELRRHLARLLPAHALPATIVALPQLPLAPNGKLDRRALAELSIAAPPGLEHFAAGSITDDVVRTIWQDVLGRAVGHHDDFFELGGHSLSAMQIMVRIRRTFGVSLPLQTLFEARTVAGVTRAISAMAREGTPPAVRRRPADAGTRLSFAQERLWFLEQLEGPSPAYNIPVAVSLVGALDVQALERSLHEIVRRHEVLRTAMPDVDGRPGCVVESAESFALHVVGAEALDATVVDALVGREARRAFDLARAPLLRALLLRRGPRAHVLTLVAHHIVADGWSFAVLVRELTTLYEAFARGHRSPLADLTVQYADVAAWQRAWLTDERLAPHLAYWRTRLAGLPMYELRGDLPRPSTLRPEGRTYAVRVSRAVSDRLAAWSAREGATLSMTLTAALVAVLASRGNDDEVVIGIDVANRPDPALETLIGFFVNQLVLRIDTAPASFDAWLRRVREATLAACAHEDAPFDRVVEALNPPRRRDHTPLFQIKVVDLTLPVPAVTLSGLDVTRIAVAHETAKFDLTVFFRADADGVEAAFEYRTALYTPATIATLGAQFVALLSIIERGPDVRVPSAVPGSDAGRAEGRPRFSRVTPRPIRLSHDDGVTIGPPLSPLGLPVPVTAAGARDLAAWTRASADRLEKLLHRHGAVLLRNFGADAVEVFEAFAVTVCREPIGDNGEHPREPLGRHVYTPVFYPAEKKILWHNENSFNHAWPTRIMFACVVAPLDGGETALADSRRVLAEIDADVRTEFIRKGVRYVRSYGGGLGLDWRSVFGTSERAAVEAACERQRMTWEWRSGDRLTTRAVRPAIARHPVTGETAWFNQAQHWHVACLDADDRHALESMYEPADMPRACTFGDGSAIPADVMRHVCDVYASLEVAIPWAPGDLLLLDNILTAHARNPYVGERKLLVAMGDTRTFETP